jgi:hypothetical protein
MASLKNIFRRGADLHPQQAVAEAAVGDLRH